MKVYRMQSKKADGLTTVAHACKQYSFMQSLYRIGYINDVISN